MGTIEKGYPLTRRNSGWQKRWSRIVGAIRILPAPQDEQALLGELTCGHGVRVLGFVNAYGMNSIVSDTAFFDALVYADILLRDGSGMALLYHRRGWEAGLNMNGTDLIPKILASFHGRRVAMWGTEEPYLGAAAKHCETTLGVRVVSHEDGFHEIDFYRCLALATQPELIVLGMGMPKQERVAHALRSVAGLSALIVCGGAIIDFLGGKVRRAPAWMRLLGIEWAYRLAHEPKRLFRRYVVGNPLFLWRVEAWLMNGTEQ